MLIKHETLKMGAGQLIGSFSVRKHEELGQTCWWFAASFDLGLEILDLYRGKTG